MNIPYCLLGNPKLELHMLWLRKIVFYIFAFVYLILCPLIVARMLGFVINPLTHRLVKTGLVYVSTNPPDATVYIDGRVSHQKTPTVIKDLTPGQHFIRIELNGYNDWERHIPIVGKKATVLANTLLIPEEWPIQKISKQPYQNIFFADDDILIATTKDKNKFLEINLNQDPPVIKDILPQDAQVMLQRSAHYIQEKFLINGNNDLLTRKGMWIRLYPKEDFGSPQVYDIAKSLPLTNMYFEEKNGELFYLDNDTGFLSAARILPYHPILNIPIPDALKNKYKENNEFDTTLR